MSNYDDLLERAKEKLSPESLRAIQAMSPELVNRLMLCGHIVTDAMRTSVTQGATVGEALGATIGSCIRAALDSGMSSGEFMKLVAVIIIEAEKISTAERTGR